MLPKYHILFGSIFITILYFLFPQIGLLNLTIIFLSSVLIDSDHVIYYFFKKKNLNPFNAYHWFIDNVKKTLSLPMSERKKIYSGFYLFHGIEWIILLFLLGIYLSPFFLYISIGFAFHMILDIPDEIYQKRTVDKISLIWNYYRWRKLKKQ